MLDHFALDTYRRELEQRRLSEVAADRLADLATAAHPHARARLAALLLALAAHIEPDAASALPARGRLALE